MLASLYTQRALQNYYFQLREHWWAQFCNGMEEFQVLNPAEKKIVLKNAPLANRLCRGLYFVPGAVKNLLSIVKVGIK